MKREELFFVLAVAGSAVLAFGCLFAEARERWLPGQENYDAALRGTDCSIMRGLETEARERVESTRKNVSDQREALKRKRLELEACGRGRGFRDSQDPEADEVNLAEICPAEYSAWLSPGYRYRMLAQDLTEAAHSLALARAHLRFGCSRLSPQ